MTAHDQLVTCDDLGSAKYRKQPKTANQKKTQTITANKSN